MRRAFFFLLLISTGTTSQKNHTSGLLDALKNTKSDTVKVNLYYSISRKHWEGNIDSVLLMAARGIELADSIGFKKGKALNCLSMGVGLSAQGNYPAAIKYYLECLKLSEELKLEGLSGNVYSNIAIAYVQHGNPTKAIEYFNRALHIAEKYGEAATCAPLINLCDLHTKTGAYALARKYGIRAVAISRAQGDSSNLATALFNLSEIWRAKSINDSARLYLKESAVISFLIEDRHGVSYCLNSMAEMALNDGNFYTAIDLADQSLKNLEQITNRELLMNTYNVLYQSYFALKNFSKALYYRNKEVELRNDIFNIEKAREANNLVNQYNLERKELQIQLLERDNGLQQKEIARGSLIKKVYGAGAIVLAVLVAFLILSNIRWKNYNRLIRERTALIQEQKRTIIDQKIHLERLNRVKDRIISTISHDFRSPLTTLQGFLHLLRLNAIDGQEKARIIQQMEHSVTATLMLIENLLTWGREQMSGLTITPVKFDIHQAVEENIQLVAARAENKKIKLFNQIPAYARIVADRDVINIILRNLIANAIKFSRSNDSISISMQQESHRVIIAVKDTGIGMSPERQKSLFSGSVNPSTVGTENEKGAGIGLALCQELIQQHDGEIWIESTLGSGSTFYFSIPNPSKSETPG